MSSGPSRCGATHRAILARLDAVRGDILLVTCSAALVAAAVLFLVFRAAQARITRQTAALVDASRRDPLTGTLNHGTLVEALAAAIERRRAAADPSIALALVDVDNFRALNDTHGHGVGDRVILAVVERLAAALGPDALLGRYGPDELLVAAGGRPDRRPRGGARRRCAWLSRRSRSTWTTATRSRSPSAPPCARTPSTGRRSPSSSRPPR